jgi:hypothetical protein
LSTALPPAATISRKSQEQTKRIVTRIAVMRIVALDLSLPLTITGKAV